MTAAKLSISLPAELLARADEILTRPGEGRSALIGRILAEAVRAAEEASIDAAYDRVFARHAIRREDLERTDHIARAALGSTRQSKSKRGARI